MPATAEQLAEAITHIRREECDPKCITGDHAACFTDKPADPGGATCCGIIQRTYDAYRQAKELPLQHVARHTWAEHQDIYIARFWQRGGCDLLAWPLALLHFDACVNHGTEGKDAQGHPRVSATVLLQRAVGAEPDGVLGPATLAAIGAVGLSRACERYLLERVFRYDELDVGHPERTQFLTGGWLRRVRDLYHVVQR